MSKKQTKHTRASPLLFHRVSGVQLCRGCELPIETKTLPTGKSAYCPQCNMKLYRGGKQPLSGNLAIAITCLFLFVPSHFFPFISIRLFGVMIPATLPSGTFTLIEEGFVLLGLLIFFCSTLAPLLVCMAVITAHCALHYRKFKPFQLALNVIQKLKHWMMLDVFLVSIAISCFKLQDYSDIFVGTGLAGLVLLQLFTLMLVSRVNIRRYWETWQQESQYHFSKKTVHCYQCHLSQPEGEVCVRCKHKLTHRKPRSLQKSWAYLIAATICFFPANLYSISILFSNGQRLEDTILSGVASLITSNMHGIALIIFVASILVPAAKIVGLGYILVSIFFNQSSMKKQRMVIYFVIKWIGKWSVMDLFVISIMMTLVDRGQILDFTPGYGAVAFGMVVVLTMLATDNFDPRLIWDIAEKSSHKDKSGLKPTVVNELSNE
ncbi:paraquat-inducible protein A [Vibrio sp. JC009]|uniref:paraquat-inducible protein A n=1 Tax=Vibrio sp. JC009 TaxID=2912314 RepID=UPI0023AFCCC2|nr:paraquat-inducible protein A [Vibrio sp. JC009]WED23159.1 paraquat-inducible protein A [Vibrio sp. JC009]